MDALLKIEANRCARRWDSPVRGTHKGHQCQEGVRTWPGDYARRRAGLTILLDPSSQVPGSSRRAARGQAGAPAAQRAGGCHDHVSGTGLLSQMIERGAGACSCRRSERDCGVSQDFLKYSVMCRTSLRTRVLNNAQCVRDLGKWGCSIRYSCSDIGYLCTLSRGCSRRFSLSNAGPHGMHPRARL